MAEKWEEFLDRKLRGEAIRWASLLGESVRAVITRKCESPIERLFAACLVQPVPWVERVGTMLSASGGSQADVRGAMRSLVDSFRVDDGRPECPLVAAFAQVTLRGYRVDFLLACASRSSQAAAIEPPMLVVECDGHDFHERTKEQAARDRSRDRDLQAAGLPVFRFTGSEIYADPARCVRQAVDALVSRHDEALERARQAGEVPYA